MMHFEILVEDKSGKAMLDVLVPKILQPFEGNVSWIIHAYRGIGKIPRNLNAKAPKNRMLLNQLPRLLRGYGNTYPKNSSYPCTIIVVCDLDDRCLKEFRQELLQILDSCNPQPIVNFCIAVEEGEAWLLGDISAIKSAYPNAKDSILNFNQSDNLKWEKLADAVYPGGSNKLKKEEYSKIGMLKFEWAAKISPHMDIYNNQSPSFCYFHQKLKMRINT